MGIPGAPSNFHPKSPTTSSWLVCDTVATSTGGGSPSGVTATVIDGTPDLSGHRRVLNGSDAVVLRLRRRPLGDPGRAAAHVLTRRTDSARRRWSDPEQVVWQKPMSRARRRVPGGPATTVPQVPNAGARRRSGGARPGRHGDRRPRNEWAATVFVGVDRRRADAATVLVAQILQNAGGPANAKLVTVVAVPTLAKNAGGQQAGSVVLSGHSAERHGHPGQSRDLLVVAEDLG